MSRDNCTEHTGSCMLAPMATLMNLTVTAETGVAAGLTQKQCEVLDLLLQHKSNKEIARILDISPSAVDQRLASARLRLGTSRRGDTARRYASLRGTCAIPTGMGAQVAFERSFGEDQSEAGEDRLLLLEDVGVGGPYAFWQEQQRTPTGFRDFSVPESLWVRFGLIIAFALIIVVVALIGMSVTQSVVSLLRQ